MDIKKKVIEPLGPKISSLPNEIVQDEPKNWTALHEAAATGDEKKLQVLLARNPDRGVRESNNGNTPLHEAAWRGYSRSVKLLCAPINAKPDTKDKKNKNTTTKGILASTILDIQNNGGFTALHLAAQNGHNQSCRELLLAGADPDIKNNYGDTPLHTSCRYGHAGATRILISADCNPNKVNLNGDHPLHITCAMGRRKLTRLLLEADCDMNMKNAQGETPRDIAMRKHYAEILEILNNPQRMRNRREKHKQRNSDRKSSLPDPTDLNAITWSPYGCHYFPDPRSFPAPKLETLPKEPLKKGEQYYLDLAGHIRKGPIGVGNTCYCGPFFKHIEHKINCNRKSLRRYVHKTKESLDNKVQALAIRTNDQIEQLTRSVIADRVRCESRRLQLHRLLKRGEPLRSTTEHHRNRLKRLDPQIEASLTRSRSMEFIDRESAQSSAISNAKSCGGLLDHEAMITVHQTNELCSDSDEEGLEQAHGGSISVDSIDHSDDDDDDDVDDDVDGVDEDDEDVMEEYDIDFYKAAESLSKILEKAKLFNEIKKEAPQSGSECIEQTTLAQDAIANATKGSEGNSHAKTSIEDGAVNGNSSREKNCIISYTPIDKLRNRYENLAGVEVEAIGTVSENTKTIDPDPVNPKDTKAIPLQCADAGMQSVVLQRNVGENQFLASLHRNEYTLQNVISALRKDRREISKQRDYKITNETDAVSEDKLSYKDDTSAFLTGNEYIHQHQHPHHHYQHQHQHRYIPPEQNAALFPNNKISNTIPSLSKWHPAATCTVLMPETHHSSSSAEIKDNGVISEINDPRVSGKIEKVEIKNSEIKSLKKPPDPDQTVTKRNKVQELVARLQGKLSATQILSHSKKKRVNENIPSKASHSESSEDEQNNHNEYKSSIQNAAYSDSNHNIATNNLTPKVISTNGNMQMQSTVIQNPDLNSPIGIPVHLPLNLPERIIPKDAYFHELPNKKRNPINVRMFTNGPSLSTTMLQGDYAQKSRQPYDSNRSISILKNQNSSSMQALQCRTPKPLNDLYPSTSSVNLSTIGMGMGNYMESNHYSGYEISSVGNNNYQSNNNNHTNCAPTQNYVHYVERDISNDSGVSTHFYGGPHGPSPSLSPQTYYPSTERLQSPKTFLYSNEMVHHPISNIHRGTVETSNVVDFTMGNVSSLV